MIYFRFEDPKEGIVPEIVAQTQAVMLLFTDKSKD